MANEFDVARRRLRRVRVLDALNIEFRADIERVERAKLLGPLLTALQEGALSVGDVL